MPILNNANKHGLKRSDLTSEQKRQLRQEAGFGCVCCGNAICDYEHIEPEFSDAVIHDVAKMAYLCIRCHGKVTRKQLSKETVREAKEYPKALLKGFSFEAFDIGNKPPAIHFGPMIAIGCTYAIVVNDRPVFWINSPEEIGGPFRLNAEFRNVFGETIFSIIDNEYRTTNDSWDVEIVGPLITIRSAPGQIVLRIRTDPPNSLVIERMDMSIEGYRIYCDGTEFTVTPDEGDLVRATKLECVGCAIAVKLGGGSIIFGVGGGFTKFSSDISAASIPRPVNPRARRNQSCACGSGKRYKHCCGSY